jgi:hypothetical protein
MQYKIKRMPFAFNGQPMQIDVLENSEGQVFFEATKIWEMSGNPKSLDIDSYLDRNQVKELMLYNYLRDNNVNSLSLIREKIDNLQNDLRAANKSLNEESSNLDIATVDIEARNPKVPAQSKQDHLNAIRMYISGSSSKLPTEISDQFVIQYLSSVFFEKNLFLDYAMSLSIGLKSHMIDVFQKYGWLEGLVGEDKIEGILSLISEIEMDKISK